MTHAGTRARVVERRSYGDHYHSLVLDAPDIASHAQPGQFVNILCGEGRASILRRPFSVARLMTGPDVPSIEVMFDIKGPGTAYLCTLGPNDPLDVLGPLGRGFPVPDEPSSCLLVGGGIGAAPLFFLGEHLRERGHKVDVLWGARRADLLLDVEGTSTFAEVCALTTEDGSAGVKGRVTDVIHRLLKDRGTDLVFACGPHPMLAAVARSCAEVDVPNHVAVEELMACGWGVCMTCVMPVRGADGSYTYLRSCTEGPVFPGGAIAWDLGADGGPPAELVPVGGVPAHAPLPTRQNEHPPPGN